MSESEVIFTPPNVLDPGSHRISVSNNDFDYSLASTDVTLAYHEDFIVRNTSLSRVHISETD